jgi:hypothetical protein
MVQINEHDRIYVKFNKLKYNNTEVIMRNIEIFSEDIKHYIYFISVLSLESMYGNLNNKSDLMGGILDRWINTISEGIIFDKYFLPKISKDYKFVADFYIYEIKKQGIAPDLIGVKTKKRTVPFAIISQNGWVRYKDAPQIEVKTFKKNQYLVSLRNQGYDEKYLVLNEMNLNSSYLIPFLSSEVLGDEVFGKLTMDDETFFADESIKKSVKQVYKLKNETKIGELRLLKVITARSFMRISDNCGPKISPAYLKNIRPAKKIKENFIEFISSYLNLEEGLFRFSEKWYLDFSFNNIKFISLKIENVESIKLIRVSKSSFTIIAESEASINEFKLDKGKAYIVEFDVLNRANSKNDEYFFHKSIIDVIEDKEIEMLQDIEKHISSF